MTFTVAVIAARICCCTPQGIVKLCQTEQELTVTEVLNRDNTTNGGHVFTQLVLRDGIEVPRAIQPRRDDLVTVRRETWEALMRVGRGA